MDDLGAFWGHFWPLLGPWGRNGSFVTKKFLQCTTRYENTTCCKISEKSNGRLSGNKPAGRTDGTDYYSPFPTKVGGLKNTPKKGCFWALKAHEGRETEFFSEKTFYSAQLDMKIQLAAKFEKNLMDGYPAIVRTDGRTDGTDKYSPFPT